MVKFDNPIFEELHNGLFSKPKEIELKIIIYESGNFFPTAYTSDPTYVKMHENAIAAAERDLKKAKQAMALFHLMREAEVSYQNEETK